MEPNLWLAAHRFSFWYWKWGGTVKKSTLYIKEGLFWLCHLHHQHFPLSISSSNFHPIFYLPVGELKLPNSPWLSIPSIGHLNKRIRWPCFNQIYLAQIYLTMFCPNIFDPVLPKCILLKHILTESILLKYILPKYILLKYILPQYIWPCLAQIYKNISPLPLWKKCIYKKIFSLSSPLLCNLSLFWPLGALKAICFGYCQNILFPHYSY